MCLYKNIKKEQRKLLKVLYLQGLYGEPRARTQEEKSGEVRPGLYERERESTKIFGTTKYLANFFSTFLLSSINELDTAIAWRTPSLNEALRLLKLIFIVCIIVINL